MRNLASSTVNTTYKLNSEEEQVSDLIYISDAELSARKYKIVVNPKVKAIGNQGDVLTKTVIN